MFFRWLKQYMPRGLYGRAALILILPVLTLQLLVSVVFIQRHFDGVTRQMTNGVNIELRYLQDIASRASQNTVGQAAQALEMDVAWPDAIPVNIDDQPWTDFTGGAVISYLQVGVPGLSEVSLADRRRVTVWLQSGQGPLQVSFPRQRVSASNPHQLLVIMVVMGVVMTTIAYFFLRNQLRPIKRMAAAAQAFGKGRIAHYSPSGAIEVRAAGTAFLDMRNRIERQTQARTMMLSGISHDLRTPLTRMRLGLSMMDDDEAAPLIADVDEMQHLLDGFLAFAQAEAEDAAENVDPHALVTQIREDCARIGQAVADGGSTGPALPLPLRARAIRRALDNLVGNALRYGQRAEISAHVTDRAIRFVVSDDGPGIPADQYEEAVRPFVRLDPARNQDKGSGVGLGLAIVADIARGHGGMLRLGKSENLGGLKAELVLPR